MRTSTRLMAILAGVVLTMLPFVVSADPGNMGQSGSNPDGAGMDKPVSMGGGTQGPAYFDGNNGCGQDRRQDIAPDQQGGFDDNNGHCGSNEQGQAHVSQVSHVPEQAQIHTAE